MKRLMLIWLTVLALLVQGWAAAAMASAVKLPAKTEALAMAGMEHCAMHGQTSAKPVSPSHSKSRDCCNAMVDCHCVSACGGVALLPALVAFPRVPNASLVATSAGAQFSAAPTAHPFRPPIL